MDRIYVDTEYIFPGMSQESGRPTQADLREIVQIAAIRVDAENAEELAAFDMLVKPSLVLPIPEFFTELTGITVKQLETNGTTYQVALAKFVEFVHEADIWTFNADWDVFSQNCLLHQMPFPFTNRPFRRVSTMLAGWGVANPANYSSGTLHQAADIEMEGQVHNALFDVRSMSRAVRVFEHR